MADAEAAGVGGPSLVRRLAEEQNTITHWPPGNPGGHFLAMHEPQAPAADIRTFFAPLGGVA